MNQKTAAVEVIYDLFSDWSLDQPWACRKGCATCCTQNVNITTLEAQQILAFIRENNQESWLSAKLDGKLAQHRPQYTTNTLARACLARKSLPEEKVSAPVPCPFLQDNCCTIYPARPFACRSFLSLKRCTPAQPALVDGVHLAAATAINQLLEHLDQKNAWGNMLDVLPLLLQESPQESSRHTLRSQPLPGLMLGADEYDQVAPLLERILATPVGNRTIEAILNGQ